MRSKEQSQPAPEAVEITDQEKNPNNIGEIISISYDIPTSPDKVYRSVVGDAAIVDLENSGVVRNRQSAGVVEKSRWGNKVFWSRGAEGKFQNVQQGGFVIEAPFSVAEKRIVRKEDVTAIYNKNESGDIVDILTEMRKQKRKEKEIREAVQHAQEATEIEKIRNELGLKPKE